MRRLFAAFLAEETTELGCYICRTTVADWRHRQLLAGVFMRSFYISKSADLTFSGVNL
jgi:hypothetical protein